MAGWILLGAIFAFGGTQPLLAEAPVNDSFAGQLTITGSTNTVLVSNSGATGEAGEPSHLGNPASASVWWNWTALDEGPVIIDTLGTTFDTVLAVYTGETVNALTLIASNDDAPGLATSVVFFPATKGTTYRIAVDGYLGATGDVRLTIRLPIGPTPPSITSQPASQTVPDNAGSNVTFSVTAVGSFPLSYEWQKAGVPLSGATNASFTITNAILADTGDYRVVLNNSFGNLTSSVAVLTVLAGFDHDLFAGRVPIIGQTNTLTAHNYGATTEVGEPVHAGVASGGSLWWSWTAPQSGLTRLDTEGSANSAGDVLDTVLAVYLGSSLDSLTPVAANNDETPGLIPSSKVFFRAVAGVRYQIAVAGLRDPNGTVAVGNITLNLSQGQNNDFLANASAFPTDATTVYDNNVGATEELGEPDHAGNPVGKSVWWSWVAPTNGTYALDTVGSSIDTVLAVYTGSAFNSLSLVGEDDNRSDEGASLVKFLATGGTSYRFAIDGFSETDGVSAGDIVLNLNPALDLNDDFNERTPLSGQTNLVTVSNQGAGKELGEPNHGGNAGGRSLWWTWTAHINGPVVVTTRNSTFDTTLAVYTGTRLDSLTLLGESDDADPTDARAGSSVLFMGIGGRTYQIAVDGYRASDGSVAAGTVVLGLVQITPPAQGSNDLFADRFQIIGSEKTVTGVNTNASDEVGEPNHSGNDGGRSVWWSWVAPVSAAVRVDTLGSGFDTILGVYQGASIDTLTLVAADQRSADDGKSIVTFEAVQGVEYQIAVDGFNDGTGAASGRVLLSVHQYPPGALHANDDFENASPISDQFLTVLGSNIGATRQPGEPSHVNTEQGHSVWWTWTASNDGPVTISTAGSPFDTLLGIYTGNSVESLSLLAENDDIDSGDFQSSVTFQAVRGTVYRIAVDGYGNQIGVITLTVALGEDLPAPPQIQQLPMDQTRFSGGRGGGSNVTFNVVATGSIPLAYQWSHNGANIEGATSAALFLTNITILDAGTYQVTVSNRFGVAVSTDAELALLAAPFNDNFTNRIQITGKSNVVRGSTLYATKEPNEPHHGGDVGGRSVWWKWIAPTSGPVEIHTLGTSFDTLLAVYTGNSPDSLTLLAENDDIVSDRIYASRVLFSAVAGMEYQIAVDGFKTNYTAGNVVLTLKQPPQPPAIVAQPTIHVIHGVYTVEATISVLSPLFTYQWFFNGGPIVNATNTTYVLGPPDRTKSGLYSLVISNEFGSSTSSNLDVWIKVPQQLLAPQQSPKGQMQLPFSDPDGTLSSEPGRFEVHHTYNLSGPTTLWITNQGGISMSNGRFLYTDPTAGSVSQCFYRIIEK